MRKGLDRWTSTAETTEVRVLAWGCLGSGAASLATAAVPFSQTAPRSLAAGLGLTGVVLGVAMVRGGERVPRLAVHAMLLAVTAIMGFLMVASSTPTGRVVTSYGYVWLAMFTACFHPRRVAIAHLAAMALSFGLGLAVASAPSAPQTWAFVMASVAGVALVLNHVVGSLRALAERDQLTGLLNRSAFGATVRQHMGVAERTGQPLSLAIIDLDDFKVVNDQDGHEAGDRLLEGIAAAWRNAIRQGDVLGRHGGDEFVLLMPATGERAARRVLRRLHDVSPARWSAGVAQWQGEDLSSWLGRADDALYASKRSNRASSLQSEAG